MYFISLFSPGRRYAGIVSKQTNFDLASMAVANIILANGEDDGMRVTPATTRQAEREGDMLCAYAPSKITLLDGATLFIDNEPRRSC